VRPGLGSALTDFSWLNGYGEQNYLQASYDYENDPKRIAKERRRFEKIEEMNAQYRESQVKNAEEFAEGLGEAIKETVEQASDLTGGSLTKKLFEAYATGGASIPNEVEGGAASLSNEIAEGVQDWWNASNKTVKDLRNTSFKGTAPSAPQAPGTPTFPNQ
jgi:hypothetical protein